LVRATNHAVICELFIPRILNVLNAISSLRRPKISGTLHINHEEILFALLQRPITAPVGFNHRFLAMRMQEAEISSAVLVKVGDTTKRPLAAETILRKIPTSERSLTEAYANEVVGAFDANPVPPGSVNLRLHHR